MNHKKNRCELGLTTKKGVGKIIALCLSLSLSYLLLSFAFAAGWFPECFAVLPFLKVVVLILFRIGGCNIIQQFDLKREEHLCTINFMGSSLVNGTGVAMWIFYQVQIVPLLTLKKSCCQCQIWQKQRCATITFVGPRDPGHRGRVWGRLETRATIRFIGRRCNDPKCKFAHGSGELRSMWTYPIWPMEALAS